MPSSRIPSAVQLLRKGFSLHSNDGLRASLEVARRAPAAGSRSCELPFQCVAAEVEAAVGEVVRRGRPDRRRSWPRPRCPAVYPPVVIDGVRYVDGGVHRQRPDRPGGRAGVPHDLRAARRCRTADPTRRSAGRSTAHCWPTGSPATAASPGTWPSLPDAGRGGRAAAGPPAGHQATTTSRQTDELVAPGLRELRGLPGRAGRAAGRAPPRRRPAAADRAAGALSARNRSVRQAQEAAAVDPTARS